MKPLQLPPREAWVVVLLRAFAFMVAAGALLLHLSLVEGTVAAVAGTLGASVGAVYLARSRVRLGAVWALAGLSAVVGLLLAGFLVQSRLVSDALGTRDAMVAADVVRFGVLTAALVLAMRTTATRRPAFGIVELVVVALALAGVVAAHRDGAINQPRILSDWALTHGRDPVQLLLYVGAGTMGLLLLSTLHERRGRGLRVGLHLVFLLLLSAAALLLVPRVAGMPVPPRGQGLVGDSHRGKGHDKAGGKAGGGGGKSSDQMNQLEFRDNYDSPSSQSPVAVVLLHDDYSPPLGYYYFRQTAFSQFNGNRLVATTRDDIDRDILPDFPTQPTTVPNAPQPGNGRTLVHTTVALLSDHIRPFGLESPMEYVPKPSPDPSRFVRAYDVVSASMSMRYEDLLGRKPGKPTWTAEQRAAYTQLPDDPRYKELADKIVDESLRPGFRHDPFAQAMAISAWLSKNSTYSLHSHHASATDPTADFLFGDRIGYCVHFAHAAAYLLRARGLPSRIAAGYVADEGRRGNGSTIMLRQKDAHAWAELYLDGYGWIIVDVAPARVLDPPDTPPDPDLQRMLGELARGNKTGGLTPDGKPKQLPLKQIGWAMLLILIAQLVFLYAAKVWRRVAPLLAGERSIHRVAYRAALDVLTESGWRRRPGETREAFARRLAARVPDLGRLTDAHLARAYGSRRLLAVAEMRALAARVVRQARGSAKWWRRLLGRIDPTAWLRSR